MTNHYLLAKHNRFWLLMHLFFALTESKAQTPMDSTYRQMPLYKKGQNQIAAGGILLTVGTLGALAMSSQTAKEPSGISFGPSTKDMGAFVVGLIFGGTGLILLTKGLRNVHRAKTQFRLGFTSYQKQPGLQGYMPSLSLCWQTGKATATRQR
ncbi:MAG TPA: hypothetical protein VFL47_16450 [Flavisolibacter sp.]|nr:hypothetical protein [Flavisolibacter sp.]